MVNRSAKQSAKAPRPRHVMCQIQAQVGGDLRTSQRGVPYLVLADDVHCVSLCYFRKTRKLRLFKEFGGASGPGSRVDFLTWVAAKAYLTQLFFPERAGVAA